MPEGYLPIQQRTQERIVARTHFRVERHPTAQHPVPNGQDTRPGHCPRQQLIGQPPSMIDQAREVFCQGRFPASLIYALIVSPSPAVPSPLCRLPLVILQQAAQSFSTPHCSRVPSYLRPQRKQDAIAFALMVPLFMVMQQILLQGSPPKTFWVRAPCMKRIILTVLTGAGS